MRTGLLGTRASALQGGLKGTLERIRQLNGDPGLLTPVLHPAQRWAVGGHNLACLPLDLVTKEPKAQEWRPQKGGQNPALTFQQQILGVGGAHSLTGMGQIGFPNSRPYFPLKNRTWCH